MPEGDTAHLSARTLHRALAGETLKRTDFRVPALATVSLAGQQVREVVARGKHILLRTDADVTVHSHLSMEGAWHVYAPRERWRRPAHEARAVLETEPRSAVGFRLGLLEVVTTARERDQLAHLGPDPLGPDWDAEETLRRLRAHGSRPIGEALLDQRIIAGIGNVYRNEVLFLRGLDPSIPAAAVPDQRALVELAARLLQANAHTSRRTTTGDTREGNRLWVYGRAERACRRCGTTIVLERDAEGRSIYRCPSCQPAG